MGFYLRKSISVGPIRFNLSKSGVGVSAGVRGLRFGSGPRGNYVHMGRHGLYYRQTIPSPVKNVQPPVDEKPNIDMVPSNTHDPLTDIESSDVSQMTDSTSAGLLSELNEKQKKIRLWPMVAAISTIILLAGLSGGWPGWGIGSVFVVGAIGTYVTLKRDELGKTVVLFYGFDEEMGKAYEDFHSHASTLASCAKAWHIAASGRVRDRKYHAGADELVSRKPTFIRKAAPPYVKTNISTVSIGVGRQTLHFFPDRVLVYDVNGVGAVSYKDLRLEATSRRFIESDAVPNDAQVLDYTWQYVNKSGGPDKRFKSNKKLPICLYNELHFRSDTGLNELIQLSKATVSEGFVQSVNRLAGRLQQLQDKGT